MVNIYTSNVGLPNFIKQILLYIKSHRNPNKKIVTLIPYSHQYIGHLDKKKKSKKKFHN
jgi:hypothetical protein